MPDLMQAAIVEAFGKPLVLRELNVPTPGPGQILVKTEACGVCHTDLHAARGDWEKGQVEHQVQTIRGRFFQPRLRFASFEELNGWLEAECRRWAATHPHPEHKDMTVAQALDAERPALQPMLAPFDGFHESQHAVMRVDRRQQACISDVAKLHWRGENRLTDKPRRERAALRREHIDRVGDRDCAYKVLGDDPKLLALLQRPGPTRRVSLEGTAIADAQA